MLYSKGLEGEKGKMGGQGGRGGKVTWELEEPKGRKESKGGNVMWDLKVRMLRKRHWFDMNNVERDGKSLYVLASLVWVGRHFSSITTFTQHYFLGVKSYFYLFGVLYLQ